MPSLRSVMPLARHSLAHPRPRRRPCGPCSASPLARGGSGLNALAPQCSFVSSPHAGLAFGRSRRVRSHSLPAAPLRSPRAAARLRLAYAPAPSASPSTGSGQAARGRRCAALRALPPPPLRGRGNPISPACGPAGRARWRGFARWQGTDAAPKTALRSHRCASARTATPALACGSTPACVSRLPLALLDFAARPVPGLAFRYARPISGSTALRVGLRPTCLFRSPLSPSDSAAGRPGASRQAHKHPACGGRTRPYSARKRAINTGLRPVSAALC